MHYIIGRASTFVLIFSGFFFGDFLIAQETPIDSSRGDSVRAGETTFIPRADSSSQIHFFENANDSLEVAQDSVDFDPSLSSAKSANPASDISIDAPVAAAAVAWRILPLGDSITRGHATAGSSPEGGYRDDLAALLSSEGISYDFVGSQATGSGFDRNHEGHSGKTADFIDANVTGFLQARSAKAVLLHIGTNDISADETPASTASEIASIIDKINALDPETRIILCGTIPRNDTRDSKNGELVGLIQEVYYEKLVAGYPVFYAGQNEIFKLNSNYKTAYMFDTVHPNNTGYHLLAEVFLSSVTTALTHNDAFITDNFNRNPLGPTWVVDPEFAIANNELKNTGTSSSWNYLAVHAAQANPTEVSIRWSPSAEAGAVRLGGLALRLNSASTNASGYLAYIDDSAALQLWTIDTGQRGHLAQSAASAILAPLPGDVFRVNLSTDGSGHHFDYYLNDQFAGRLTDPAKVEGNAARQFAGVLLRGNANNPVDDFFLNRASQPAVPTLTLTSPNGGESWTVGNNQNITWSSTGGLSNVKLEYSIDNGSNWTTIISSTANDGSQSWMIPNAPTSQALVRVSDASDGDPNDVSNSAFSITAPGANQYALSFDGVDDYAQISDNALLSGGAGKSLTVEAWVKPQTVSGTRPIVHKFLDGNTKDWGFGIFDGTIEAAIESSSDNWELSAGAVAAGVWTHIALVFDNSANLVRLYVNGVQATQKTLSKDMPDSNAPIRIGRHGYGTDYYSGEIEEVRIWNTARSASQITAAMNGQLLGNEAGLIGYWSFNQGSGQTAEDGTSNNNDGRLGNATNSDAADPAWVNSNAPLGAVTSTLTLSSPNGGESLTVGNNHNITWSSQGSVANVKLEYSIDNGGNWTTIVASTSNDGSQSWTIPDAVTTQALVRVSDASDGDPGDVSNAVFTIVTSPPPIVTLTSPNGGESWTVGNNQNITWNSTGGLGNVKLEYSIDNGSNWTTIAASTSNDGNQSWTIPSTPTSQALVRVSDASDGDPNDVSNSTFSITAPGANQYALSFDGVDDYAQISDNALLSGGAGKSLTVEAWVKPATVSGTRPVAHKFLDGNTKDWGFGIFDGTIEAAIESGGDNWEMSGGSVSAGVWTHIALVFDNSANLVRLYVNGVQATQKTLSKDMPDSNAPIRIGRHGYGSDYYSGEIEEGRVWNTARSASQITAAMNGQLLGNEAGLIGYWAFNEASGQAAGDGTANGNSGRLGNATNSDVADPTWIISTAPLGPVASTLTLSNPNGGESWEVGSVHSITWNSQGSVANLKLEYSTNNGTNWTTIIASTPNDGKHSWTVPDAVWTQCLVRVSDVVDGDPSDQSNAVFSIITAPQPPAITTFTPASGEVGSQVTITGSSFVGVSSVTFNGTASGSFIVDSATQIRATVPSGATSGKISVITPGGVAQSANDFTVIIVSTSFTFNPTHDTYVKSSTATSSYGTATTLRLRKNSSETIYSYLKFAVTGLSGAVQSAKVRLYVTEASNNGGEAYTVSNNYKGTSTAWVEGGLNWNNAPDISGTVLSSSGAVDLDTWVDFDVTSAISGNGTFSIGFKSNSTDLVWYASKEGAKKPELVIETSSATAPAKSLEVVDSQAEPEDFTLIRNHPNPFNGQTTIEYSLPEPSQVRINIYNALGQLVRTLVDENEAAGTQRVIWEGKDNFGQSVGSGIYFYELQAGAQRLSGKMTLQQ